MLQLFVDDSRQQEDVLVLAGYAAHPLKWAAGGNMSLG